MSVAEILHQIEALPVEERLQLTDKLIELKEADAFPFPPPPLTEAERLELEENLKSRPNLGAELAEKLDRMQAGHCIDLEDAKALLAHLDKLGL